jgi:hypothetical protein
MTTWTPPPPPLPAPAPELPPLYLPNLIAALVASVGIVIGSLGPWMTILFVDRTATDGDGAITLVLGIISAVALFVVFNLGRSRTKTSRMARLSNVAMLAGAGAFVVGVAGAGEVTSRHIEWFGTTINAQIGWGLWLVLIGSLVLMVTATVVVKQVRKVTK